VVEEAYAFDIERLLDEACLLNLVHEIKRHHVRKYSQCYTAPEGCGDACALERKTHDRREQGSVRSDRSAPWFI